MRLNPTISLWISLLFASRWQVQTLQDILFVYSPYQSLLCYVVLFSNFLTWKQKCTILMKHCLSFARTPIDIDRIFLSVNGFNRTRYFLSVFCFFQKKKKTLKLKLLNPINREVYSWVQLPYDSAIFWSVYDKIGCYHGNHLLPWTLHLNFDVILRWLWIIIV